MERRCSFCGSTHNCKPFRHGAVCADCLSQIRELEPEALPAAGTRKRNRKRGKAYVHPGESLRLPQQRTSSGSPAQRPDGSYIAAEAMYRWPTSTDHQTQSEEAFPDRSSSGQELAPPVS